jgi:DNA-directed RNA polymerase I, II, and III subunit RPABC1
MEKDKDKDKEKNIMENKVALLPKLYRVWKTLMKMIEDRKYKYIENDPSLTYKKWKEIYERNPIAGICHYIPIPKNSEDVKRLNPQDAKRLYFEYLENSKIGAKEIEYCISRMRDALADSGIIIISGVLTSQGKQKIAEVDNIIQLQCFNISELMVNITEHSYVPKHELLSEEEKNMLLKRYKIKENQLPKILTTDPIAKYFGLRKGNVVKIIRDSETAGKYVTYRITV